VGAPNLCFCEEPTEKAAFETVLDPRDLNFALLREFSGIRIKWVDNIAPHMELDTGTSTLFLFRLPSFCLMNIPQEAGRSEGTVDSVLQRYFVEFQLVQFANY
jgi:hypothetical protein